MLGSEAPGLILHRPSRQGESRKGLEGVGAPLRGGRRAWSNAEFGVKSHLPRLAPAYLLATAYRPPAGRITRTFHRITANAGPAAQSHDQRRTAVGAILRRVGRAALFIAALALGANPRLWVNLQPLGRNELPTVFAAARYRPVVRIVFDQNRGQSQFAATSARNLRRQGQGQLPQLLQRRLAVAVQSPRLLQPDSNCRCIEHRRETATRTADFNVPGIFSHAQL